MIQPLVISRYACRLLFGGILFSTAALASVIAAGPDAFPAGSPVLQFEDLTNEMEVNGLIYKEVLFTYLVGGTPLNGAVAIESFNLPTNHVTVPFIAGLGDSTGALSLVLPEAVSVFGYGFALNSVFSPSSPNLITTISVFSGTTDLGTLSYKAVPDPGVPGGFAGIESTIPFDRVALTFNSIVPGDQIEFFVVDNITFATAASVPEPSTILLAAAGLLLCLRTRDSLR